MNMTLEFLLPDQLLLRTEIRGLQAGDSTGRFGLRPGHLPFVTTLTPGLVLYWDAKGNEHYAAVDGGVLLLENNKVQITSREVILASRLEDLSGRAAEILESRKRSEKSAHHEFEHLHTALLQQLAKLRGV